MTDLRFDGKVVAITGAAQNMGREYALLLAARGAKIVVNDFKGATETVETIIANGGAAIENCADISDPAQTDGIVDQAIGEWGRIDAVINNAGGYGPSFPDPAMTLRMLGSHLIGTMNLIRSALPYFRRQKYGRILNIGSGSMFGMQDVAIYAATKGGVFGFTRALAKDLEREEGCDIKANVLMPAAFPSGLINVPDAELQKAIDEAFVGSKIAPAAAVLVHEQCPSNGETIQVGGGRHARVVLSTTEGWQAPDDNPTPEQILAHWSDVVAGKDMREPPGSLGDLLIRRGFPPYSLMDLIQWTRTGNAPSAA